MTSAEHEQEAKQAGGTSAKKRKKKSGIPTGNAGEYFVMGELLRRGFDAQLADRNTADYDVLVGKPKDPQLTKIQVKSVRAAPWYVRASDFEGEMASRITIYVLLGAEKADRPVRYFITRNADVASHLHRPAKWPDNGFMPLKGIEDFRDRWDLLEGLSPAQAAEASGAEFIAENGGGPGVRLQKTADAATG